MIFSKSKSLQCKKKLFLRKLIFIYWYFFSNRMIDRVFTLKDNIQIQANIKFIYLFLFFEIVRRILKNPSIYFISFIYYE